MHRTHATGKRKRREPGVNSSLLGGAAPSSYPKSWRLGSLLCWIDAPANRNLRAPHSGFERDRVEAVIDELDRHPRAESAGLHGHRSEEHTSELKSHVN